MVTIDRRALSVAFRMASATSFALPNPMPTRPFLSPMVTMALKLNRRPPFTTFAQRFTATTFSTNSLSWLCNRRTDFLLELETGFARAVRQSFHSAVIQISAAIEGHRLDPGRHGLFRRDLPDQRPDRRLALGVPHPLPHIRVKAGDRQQALVVAIVENLDVNVLQASEHA